MITKRILNFGWPFFLAMAFGSAAALPADEIQRPQGAPPANALTLDAALRLALENNPELRVLAADVAAARGEVMTAKTWPNPEVSLAPGVKQVRNPSTQEFHGDFGLEQTIEWPGKRVLRGALAEKNVALRQLALAGLRSQLAIQVRRLYHTLLATREVVAVREQRLSLANSFALVAQKKVAGGFVPEFESTKAGVEIAAAQRTLREAQSQFESAQLALNTLLGRNPTDPLEVIGILGGSLILPNESALVAQALAHNPSLQVQELEAQRTGLSLQSVRKARLPDFKVGPRLEFASDEQTIGLGISVPLPFWDRKRGEIATATAEQEKALATLAKLRSDVVRDVLIASRHLQAARDALAYYPPDLRQKLQLALDAASQSYAEGKSSLLLYLETQRSFFGAQSDYLEAIQKLHEAEAELESSLGFTLDQLPPSGIATK